MFRIKSIIYISNKIKSSLKVRTFSKSSVNYNEFLKSNLRTPAKKKQIGPLGWFLLLVPATTFGLGTWQVQRKKWKESLIAELHSRTQSRPVPLPEDLSELKELEYHPIHVKGYFLHAKELYMGPRSLLLHGDASTAGGLMSKNQSKNSGYLVVTPFKLADRDVTILVNRGWVPGNNKDPRTRIQGQINGEVELVGVVRLNENRPTFIPNNRPESNSWFYRDLETMSKLTNSAPVFLDVISEFDVPGGPKGGQTRVTLRNEHLSYVFTWYSLCGFTSFMWYRQFLKGLPPI
ncbi:Surfeit 1 [Carabus blaptoides fortunei]